MPKIVDLYQPGKTLLINHFIVNDQWYLVDLPGYGYAQRSKKTQEKLSFMIKSYILQREQLANLFLLIDVRHSPQKIDLEFINFLGEAGIPFAIIFTKADKISREKLGNNVRTYMEKLSETWEELPPHFITSSEKKEGRTEVLDYIDHINKELSSTSEE